jgi:hypothetical protein
MADADSSTSSIDDRAARITILESELATAHARVVELERERDELRAAYDRLWLEVELMRRRIFIAKAERADTTQLELEFKDKLAELDQLAGTIGIGPSTDESTDAGRARVERSYVALPRARSRPAPLCPHVDETSVALHLATVRACDPARRLGTVVRARARNRV